MVTHTTAQAVGRVSDALSEYRRAVALDPHLASAFNNIGASLLSLAGIGGGGGGVGEGGAGAGLLGEAKDAYEAAIRLDPAFAEALFGLSVVLTQRCLCLCSNRGVSVSIVAEVSQSL